MFPRFPYPFGLISVPAAVSTRITVWPSPRLAPVTFLPELPDLGVGVADQHSPLPLSESMSTRGVRPAVDLHIPAPGVGG